MTASGRRVADFTIMPAPPLGKGARNASTTSEQAAIGSVVGKGLGRWPRGTPLPLAEFDESPN